MMNEILQNSGLVFWPAMAVTFFGAACFIMVLRLFRPGSNEPLRSSPRMNTKA